MLAWFCLMVLGARAGMQRARVVLGKLEEWLFWDQAQEDLVLFVNDRP